MPKPIVCHFCKAKLTEAEVYEFDDTIMCFHCLDELTTICECCMERIWRDEAEGGNTHTLCRYCYENNYTTCSECGRLIHNDDAHYTDDSDEPYCQDCYDKMYNKSLHAYYYKPSPIFYGSEGDSLLMGVELEIDEAGEDSYHAQQIIEIANKHDERIYCKHDGSLDDGFEIVSHPMTLDFHQNEMNWCDVLAKAINLGYTSHNAGSCGLHIHCN